jgi:hypothetical protein
MAAFLGLSFRAEREISSLHCRGIGMNLNRGRMIHPSPAIKTTPKDQEAGRRARTSCNWPMAFLTPSWAN